MTYGLSNGGRNYLNRNDYLGDLSVRYLLSGSVYAVKLSDFSPKVISNDLQHIKITWQLPGSVELNQTFSVVGTEMDWNITFRNRKRFISPLANGTRRCQQKTTWQNIFF